MFGPTRISTGDPFGLFRASKEIAAAQTLIVLPMLFDIKSFLLPPGLLPGGQIIRRKSSDITPHAAGGREYVHGDAMKRIHWTTSIRRNQLMDDLQGRYLRPVVVLLDIETFGGMRGADKIARSSHERHAPVCVIKCDDKLPLAFSEFSTDIKPQENHTWQSPILSH